MATGNFYTIQYSTGVGDNTGNIDINPGAINSTDTSINLPGEGNVFYGQPVDQSLVNMVQNFSGTLQPRNGLPGQLWYETTTNLLKINVGSKEFPSWQQLSTGNIIAAGSNTQVQFNDGGGLGAITGFTVDKTSNTVSVSGNVNVLGNINANSSVIANNYVYSNVYQSISDDVILKTTTANANVSLLPGPGGTVDVNDTRITNLAEPVENKDAVTKYYVDQIAQGVRPKFPCYLTSTEPLPGSVVYYNGPANDGVGSTLTISPAITTLDGLPISLGMRVLIKNEVNAAHNGIYVVSTLGATTVLTRPDGDDLAVDWLDGAFVFVEDGVELADTGWVLATEVVQIGVSPLIFLQVSAPGTYIAGTGLGLDGRTFFIANTGVISSSYGSGATRQMPVFTVNPQGQLTSATTEEIQAAGSNTQVQFNTNGSFTGSSALTFNNSTGTLSTTNITAASTVSAVNLSGTVTTPSQPSITSLGTLTGLTVNGTTVSTFFVGDGSRLNNLNGANVTGTVPSAQNASFATNAGTVTNASQPNITSVGTLSGLNVGGSATVSGTLTVYGPINSTGEITAFISDDRLKTKLGKIDNALSKLLQLEGFIYEPNEQAQQLGYEKKRHLGISAQKALEVVPEVVTPAPIGDGYLSVKYEKLIPLVIEAIRDLQEEINDLKKRV